ncbi:VrrA/YqfQ family protein [Bacillus sp. FJAT-50079]|uniref:VrrA/YqfQ family protein n=1 Tax=Bacillus sp. FJAT-50079 TaxID=2833577 RepID=UPI001BC8D897|nr:VrrA/YqfQ family protein [Bacillus sp. FJAT-50079]MBS4209091.1 hypothetical protein [Bacillus sp. FJAT-50079]
MQRNPFGPNHGRMMRPPPRMSRGPQLFRNGPPLQNGQGGGRNLLSALFQRQGSQAGNIASGFSRATEGTSLLQGLASPQKIGSFLNQTQQVIKTAQQFGPMVQQYGPLVKNLPAMWKIYRGLKNVDTDPTPEIDDVQNEPTQDAEISSEQSENESVAKPRRTRSGESVPKLYIS